MNLDPIALVISDLWPTWKPSPGMLALWGRLLEDLQPKEVEAAVLLHACESQFPPSLSDIRRLALAERGLTPEAARQSSRVLLGLAKPALAASREDALDTSREESWRNGWREQLRARYEGASHLGAVLPEVTPDE